MPSNRFPIVGGAKFFGGRVERVEDPRFLLGQGTYTSNLSLPRMTSACFVRAAEAHSRIVEVDKSGALDSPGLVAIFTAEDIALTIEDHGIPIEGLPTTPQPVLAAEKTRYVGEPIAVVVGEDRYAAEDAAEAVFVESKDLGVVADLDSAMADGAPLLHEDLGSNVLFDETKSVGEVEAAFASARHTFDVTYETNRFVAAPMEGRGLVADFRSGTQDLTVWCSTQTPFLLRTRLAAMLDLPESKVRVIAPDVGGGFGQKMSTYPEEVAVAAAAIKLGRPVAWIEDRRENLLAGAHSKEQRIRLQAAVSDDGEILAMKATFIGDAGAYSINTVSSLIEPGVGATNFPNVYRLPNLEWRIVSVATNRCPVGAFRGVGSTAAVSAQTLLFTHIASELELDVADFLRRNMISADEMPHTTATGLTYDSGRYVEAMEMGLEMVGYKDLKRRREELRAKGSYLGIGIAPFVEAAGWGSEHAAMQGLHMPSHDNASVSVDPGGGVTVTTSMTSQGQGHETTWAQIAADILGVDMSTVSVKQGDTAVSPYGMGTYASRSAIIAGATVSGAAEAVRDKALKLAGKMLEADVADLELGDGRVFVRGAPSQGMTFADLASAAHWELSLRDGEEHTLFARRFHDPPATFSNGCVIAVAEVDVELGAVKLERIVAVEDCGVVINPQIVEGQAEGAIAQGVGGALLEEMVYDESGQLLTSTYIDYLLPTAIEVPPIEVGHMETPSPKTVGGVKGMGEGGLIAAPAAVACAVADALQPFGALVDRLPLTPERVQGLAGDTSDAT